MLNGINNDTVGTKTAGRPTLISPLVERVAVFLNKHGFTARDVSKVTKLSVPTCYKAINQGMERHKELATA